MPALRKEKPFLKDFIFSLSNKAVNYYFKTTPGKVVLYALRASSAAYFAVTVGWPLVSLDWTRESIRVVFEWTSFDRTAFIIYMVVNVIIVCVYLFTQRYGGKENEEAHQRQEAQHEKLQKTVDGIDSTLRGLSSAPRAMILRDIQLAKSNIEKLKLSIAYEYLENLRRHAEEYCPEDKIAFAMIEYWEACCIKYSKPVDAVKKFTIAFNLMRVNPSVEIIEGYIFAQCFNGKAHEVKSLIDEHRDLLHDSPWVYIPDFLLSEDKNTYFSQNQIHDDKLVESILAESILPMQVLCQNVDLGKFQITVDESLELGYRTFPIWVLYLSIAKCDFLRNCKFNIGGKATSTPESELLYSLTSKFLDFTSAKEVIETISDLEIYHDISGYLHDRNSQWITDMQKHIDKCVDQAFGRLGLSFALYDSGNPQDAIQTLVEYKDRPTVITWNLIILLLSQGNLDKVEDYLLLLLDNGEDVIPELSYYAAINIIRHFHERFATIAKRFSLQDDPSTNIYHCFVDLFCGNVEVADFLIEQEDKAPVAFKVIYPYVYKAKGDMPAAIARAKANLAHEGLTPESFIYVEMLEEANHKRELVKYLRNLRHQNNVYRPFLSLEFGLQIQLRSHRDIVEICDLMYQLDPNNASVAYNRLIAYFDAGLDMPADYSDLIEKARKGGLNIERVKGIFKVLLSKVDENKAIEFLYNEVINSKSQSLRDFYYMVHIWPCMNKIFQDQKSIAELGDYIEYFDGTNLVREYLSEDSSLSEFVGKGVGSQIIINVGIKQKEITLEKIESKYVGLLHEIMTGITKNHSKAIRVFSFDDIKDDPIEGLKNAVASYNGVSQDVHEEIERNQLKKYSEGDNSLYLVKNIDEIEDLYQVIFGEFEVFQEPNYLLKSKFDGAIPYDKLDIVLDASSLILLHSISRKFNIEFKHRFQISQRTYDFVRDSLEAMKYQLPTVPYSSVVNANLSHFNSDNSHIQNIKILEDLRLWIGEHCKVEVVEEIIDNDYENLPRIIESSVESILLSQRANSILITEDKCFCNLQSPCRSVNLEFYLRDNYMELSDEISEYLTRLNYNGHIIDGEYVISQIKRYESGASNYYNRCLSIVKANPYILSSFILPALKFSSGIMTATRLQCMKQIFVNAFEGLGYTQTRRICAKLLLSPLPDDFKNIISDSFSKYENEQIILPSSPDITLN